MKNLRNLMAMVTLMAVLMIGASTTNAGILMSDLNKEQCTETSNDKKSDWGIVITGFTGIVITGFTGIVITDGVSTPVDCGILMSD